MILYNMDISMEELEMILAGLPGDGTISDEAREAILARIEEGKAGEYPMGEVKRQFRSKLSAEQGKRIADAIDKLW